VDTDECPTLCKIIARQRYLWDNFPVKCVENYNYSVQMELVHIYKSTIPVSLLSQNMAGVSHLYLSDCTLHGTVAGNTDGDETAILTSGTAADTGAGPSLLALSEVKGLNFLSDVFLPRTGILRLYHNQDVDLDLLPNTFTELRQLQIQVRTAVRFSTDIRLRNFDKLKRLMVRFSERVDLSVLARVCVQLDDLLIVYCQKVVLDTGDSVIKWPSVSRVVLQSSPVETRAGEPLTPSAARHRLSRMCPSAEVYIYGYKEQVRK